MPAEKLDSRIRGFVEQLAQETDSARSSEKLLAYLSFAARFHRYSLHNSLLIALQRPSATRVAGFNTWRTLGRTVKKGERGIQILAPVVVKTDDEDEQPVVRYRRVYVFDVSQTEGTDLPDDPVVTHQDCREALYEALLGFAGTQGVQVTVEPLGAAYGVSRGGSVVLDEKLSGADRFAVLAHELAHELLNHRDKTLEKKVREIEAETVSAVVCQHFAVPHSAPTYLALYGAKPEDILSRLERIHGVITSILEGVEGNLALTPQAVNQ